MLPDPLPHGMSRPQRERYLPLVRRRCCINRARSVDVYAQRSRGQPPIKSDSRVIA
ncbi:MAG: hypothetical protein V3Q69_04940 [Burkholderia sp.]